jgi:hypothetical protein
MLRVGHRSGPRGGRSRRFRVPVYSVLGLRQSREGVPGQHREELCHYDKRYHHDCDQPILSGVLLAGGVETAPLQPFSQKQFLHDAVLDRGGSGRDGPLFLLLCHRPP